jgi:hypothetical protein
LNRIREPCWKKFGSGINIPDLQHCPEQREPSLELELYDDGKDNNKFVTDLDPDLEAGPLEHVVGEDARQVGVPCSRQTNLKFLFS